MIDEPKKPSFWSNPLVTLSIVIILVIGMLFTVYMTLSLSNKINYANAELKKCDAQFIRAYVCGGGEINPNNIIVPANWTYNSSG
jgi:hypothetical protein